ncbi:MAG: metal ABC transporter ATP-binding protein [Pseudomonadota bacterium]
MLNTSVNSSPKTVLAELKAAGVYRNGKWLVRGVDVSISRGEIVTIIGPNGSGKSTTTKMLLGLLAPTAGNGGVVGNPVVSYVPQKLAMDWSLPITVRRFMSLTGRPKPAEIDAALEQTGTRLLGKRDMATLSGGEFQRVLLARAIARKPDLLVLDEPVQGVDFSGEVALYDLIGEIRDRLGCGVLLVSHDLHVVMAASDRVICLNGHVCCQGTPTDVAKSSAYQEIFGPRASATLALYEHQHDHTHLADGSVKTEAPPQIKGVRDAG